MWMRSAFAHANAGKTSPEKAGMLNQLAYPEIQAGLPSEILERRPDVQNGRGAIASREL